MIPFPFNEVRRTDCKRVLLVYSLIQLSFALGSASQLNPPKNVYRFDTWRNGTKTYLLTNVHWWESTDHQLTTIITLLSLAQNTSSIAVVPPLPGKDASRYSNKSLIGDFFDITGIKQVQPVMTFEQFLECDAYRQLKGEPSGTVALPKSSQEEYEQRLQLYGRLQDTSVALSMPPIDPENTSQKCNRFGGTVHVSADGTSRFVFLERVHFLHFCAEKFMPWWYTIRHRIEPRAAFFEVAARFMADKPKPFSVVHLNDVLELQKERGEEEIERYARQIVDALRKHQALGGTLYVVAARNGNNVKQVVRLLTQEFENIYDCSGVFGCLSDIRRDALGTAMVDSEFDSLFKSEWSMKHVEWALGARAQLFVGNIHSPFSRNICLYRKMHGAAYSMLKGFGELRKVWAWNLIR